MYMLCNITDFKHFIVTFYSITFLICWSFTSTMIVSQFFLRKSHVEPSSQRKYPSFKMNFFHEDAAFESSSFEIILNLAIVTRNNIVWKLARGYCLCFCKTFSLVPDSTECTKNFVTEKYSALFVSPKIT